MELELLMDTALFFLLTVPATIFMTMEPLGAWLFLPFALAALARGYKSPAASSRVDLFKVVKILSALFALFIVNFSQLGLGFSFDVAAGVLAVNMFEAVATDA